MKKSFIYLLLSFVFLFIAGMVLIYRDVQMATGYLVTADLDKPFATSNIIFGFFFSMLSIYFWVVEAVVYRFRNRTFIFKWFLIASFIMMLTIFLRTMI